MKIRNGIINPRNELIIPEYTANKIEELKLDKNKPSIKYHLERMLRKMKK